jgi:hypothetical protein
LDFSAREVKSSYRTGTGTSLLFFLSQLEYLNKKSQMLSIQKRPFQQLKMTRKPSTVIIDQLTRKKEEKNYGQTLNKEL